MQSCFVGFVFWAGFCVKRHKPISFDTVWFVAWTGGGFNILTFLSILFLGVPALGLLFAYKSYGVLWGWPVIRFCWGAVYIRSKVSRRACCSPSINCCMLYALKTLYVVCCILFRRCMVYAVCSLDVVWCMLYALWTLYGVCCMLFGRCMVCSVIMLYVAFPYDVACCIPI
jgi:hypothetical protein